MSYLWFIPFGAIVTAVIGIIASFVMSKYNLFYIAFLIPHQVQPGLTLVVTTTVLLES